MKNTHRRWVNRPRAASSCRQLWMPRLNPDVQNAYVMQTAQGDQAAPCWVHRQLQPSWHNPHSLRAIQPSCSPRGLHVPCHAGYNLWERQGWFCIPSAGGFMSPLNSTSGEKSCHNTAHPQSRRGSEAHTSLGMGHGMWKGRTRGWWWWWCLQQSCLLAGRRLKWSSLAMRTATKQTQHTSLLQWRAAQEEVWWVQAEMNNIFNAFDNKNIQLA